MSRTTSLSRAGFLIVAALAAAVTAAADGELFIGADTEEFNETTPDHLGRFATNGPNLGAGTIIPIGSPLNGIANGGGFLYAGDPKSTTLRRIDYDGNLLSSITAGFPQLGCCNEEMLTAMGSEVIGAGTLFHAYFFPAGGSIQLIDPATGALVADYPQFEVVGMARVGTEIWISRGTPGQVGRWNPATNIFSPVFTLPTRAGGLAYDSDAGILWVARQGGWLGPRNLAGALLGPETQPLGDFVYTIDGLAFVCLPSVTGASATPSVLWPPNHKLVAVTLSYAVSGCGTLSSSCTVSVSSNEPENGGGDGDTAPDWEIVDPTHVWLRAERSGSGGGRVYTLKIVCTAPQGGTSQAIVTVAAPHDR